MNTNPRRRVQPADHQDLAELLPAPGRPVFAQDRHRVLREHLMEHITHESAHEHSGATNSSSNTSPIAPARRRPGRRLVLVAAPLALTAVVALGVVSIDGAQDGRSGTVGTGVTDQQKVTRLLDRISLAAADRQAVTVSKDQFIYTRSLGSSDELGWYLATWEDAKAGEGSEAKLGYEGTIRQDEWISVDGTRQGLRKSIAVSSTGEPDPSHKDDMTMGGTGYPFFKQLQALPTDPDALLARFYADADNVPVNRRPEVVIENLGAFIDEATLLPDLSAAIYRALAKLPGVRVVDHVKDASGREGVGLTFKGSSKGYAWVFDSSSFVYLGTTDAALIEVGVVDKVGQVPANSA
ncbi:CU044_5270 family protein [Streptomyces sp. NPDC002156]